MERFTTDRTSWKAYGYWTLLKLRKDASQNNLLQNSIKLFRFRLQRISHIPIQFWICIHRSEWHGEEYQRSKTWEAWSAVTPTIYAASFRGYNIVKKYAVSIKPKVYWRVKHSRPLDLILDSSTSKFCTRSPNTSALTSWGVATIRRLLAVSLQWRADQVRLVADKTALTQAVLRERYFHRHHHSINVQYNSCINRGIYESFTGHSSTFITLLHRDDDEINGTPRLYATGQYFPNIFARWPFWLRKMTTDSDILVHIHRECPDCKR